MTDPKGSSFTLRCDHNGLRPVYNLGNELGDCPHRCSFCGVGRSSRVSAEWNIQEFDRQHHEFLPSISGRYHPLIYNQGNVTSPAEFSRRTLSHVLESFRQDCRVAFVSLNSRESHATPELLSELADRQLPFPVHFILGVESFSPRAAGLLGKDTRGELDRFNAKLKSFNQRARAVQPPGGYTFGLDANLVFLPELYLEESGSREGRESEIVAGFHSEVRQLLQSIDPEVPLEINLHPYYAVDTLPWAEADLNLFMSMVPSLQGLIERHNAASAPHNTHIFIGVEGTGFEDDRQREETAKWKDAIEAFNQSGRCEWPEDSPQTRAASPIS